MRLGETSGDLYAISFGLGEDYQCPPWPYDDTIKILRALDGSILEVVNFGARQKRPAEFTLVQMARTEFYALKAFCEANKGLRIRVEFESAVECVFGQQSPFNGPAVYAHLVNHTPLGESGYTANHELYSYTLSLEWAGVTSTSVPNGIDTSEIDALIDVDCVQAYPGCTVANLAALNAVAPVPPDGSKGVAQDTLRVYIMTRESGSPTWRYIYTLPANNPDLGLVDGVFHWSEFADISSSSPGIGGIAYKAGIIRPKSVRPPRYTAGHVRKNPGVERPEGFSFSIKLQERTHLYPVENNISFYEAKVSLSFYMRSHGVRRHLRTGINNENSFDYSDYRFKVEPRAFGGNKGFPSRVFDAQNYPNHALSMEGEAIIQTYGRWEVGELQAVTWNTKEVRWPSGRRSLGFVAYVPETRVLTLDITAQDLYTVLKISTLAEYATQLAEPGAKILYLKIEEQEEQPEKGLLKKVTALAAAGANVAMTLSTGYSVPPTTAARLLLHLSLTDLIISDRPCIGMRAPGYLRASAGLQVYGAPEKSEGEDPELTPVPAKIFKHVGDGENRLSVDSDYLSLQSDGNFTSQTEHELALDPLYYLHQRIDKTAAGPVAYRYFDFGFSPEGAQSSEVAVTPKIAPSTWQVRKFHQAGGNGQHTYIDAPGEARVFAAFGASSVRIIWTPWPAATSYRVTRVYIYINRIAGDGKTRTQPQTITTYSLDSSFGDGGESIVTGSTDFVDLSPPLNPPTDYEYRVQPIVAGQNLLAIASNAGRLRPASSASPTLYAVALNAGIRIAWVPPLAQARVTVMLDSGSGFSSVPGMPILSSTQDTYTITGLSNNTKYKVAIKVGTVASGAAGDVWYIPPGTVGNFAIWELKTSDNDGSTVRYLSLLNKHRSTVDHPALFETARELSQDWRSKALGFEFVVKNLPAYQGTGLPASAIVTAIAYRVDHEKLAREMGGASAMAGAKDVRLLSNFVVRCYTGDNTPERVSIQLWGIRKDGKSSVLGFHPDLETRAATESGSYGAYARFLNLPASMGGRDLDIDYKNENSGSNSDGLYTGKDLWRLPDHLFEDGAYEWSQIDTLMFAITHSESIAETKVRPAAKGLHIGFGGQPGQTWEMIREHKGELHLEVLREFSGGVKKPQYGRIDGGVKDVDGSITGAAGKPIEKALHIIDDVVQQMLGYKPRKIGNELASRDGWIWRYRAKEKKTVSQILDMFARNIHGFFCITEDDKLCLRTLNIDEGGVAPVFHLDASRILEDGVGMPEIRPRNEIFQSFRIKYHLNPVTGKCEEEMVIGWDTARGVPIQRGYRDVAPIVGGSVEAVGGLDNLDLMCQVSNLLHAPSGQPNEYGVKTEEQYELFYRPTAIDQIALEKIEAALPNLSELWGGMCLSPKATMRALMQLVVKDKFASSWYYPLKVPLSYIIHNTSISGISDELGTIRRYLDMGDKLTNADFWLTKNQSLAALILDIDISTWYEGYVTIYLWAPRPPGQYGWLIDPIWDASAPGLRRNEDYLFEGDLYGLLEEDGTDADAGAPGLRDNNEYTFPDGSVADAQGFGTGKA